MMNFERIAERLSSSLSIREPRVDARGGELVQEGRTRLFIGGIEMNIGKPAKFHGGFSSRAGRSVSMTTPMWARAVVAYNMYPMVHMQPINPV